MAVVGAYVPVAHGVGPVAPGSATKLPRGAFVQEPTPGFALNVPALHGVSADEPFGA
jgi:hypothetical protein